MYGDGSDSSVGSQTRTDHFYKKALVEAAKEQYFGQLADVRSMPKNMGKKIKQFHYMPILDDRNINDQGINAAGIGPGVASSGASITYIATDPAGFDLYFEGSDENAVYATALAAAIVDVEAKIVSFLLQKGYNTAADSYAELSAAAIVDGWAFTAQTATSPAGNLYGSSKDIGAIAGKIPVLSETGGRVNRVGMKRIELEGTIEKFGFFDEYTQESLDFDSDSELEMHITSESVKAANEINEDQIQIDLINGAGVVRYTGNATSRLTLAGGLQAAYDAGTTDHVLYDDLVKLGIELDNNRTPKHTKVITGSRMVDTKVVNAARYMYIGSELIPSIMKMVDYHGAQAFIPVAKYGSAGDVARGEFGAVDGFRIIVVPEMMKWEGAGAAVGDSDGGELFHFTGLNYDVFPMLVVGDASFTTIGFQTDGKTVKFKITHKKPGKETADRNDPYGEVGFYSIKWYYGLMILRSERIACIQTVAEL